MKIYVFVTTVMMRAKDSNQSLTVRQRSEIRMKSASITLGGLGTESLLILRYRMSKNLYKGNKQLPTQAEDSLISWLLE